MAARRTKKAPARKRPAKKTGGAPPAPIEKPLKGELRYKLKAAQLEHAAEDSRIIQESQADILRLLDRRRRNDNAWKRTEKMRNTVLNEVVDDLTPKLPDGFAIKNIDAVEGTYRAEHDPENRGAHVG